MEQEGADWLKESLIFALASRHDGITARQCARALGPVRRVSCWGQASSGISLLLAARAGERLRGPWAQTLPCLAPLHRFHRARHDDRRQELVNARRGKTLGFRCGGAMPAAKSMLVTPGQQLWTME